MTFRRADSTTGLAYNQKPPGTTLAEALGIEVPADAPGGQRIAPPARRRAADTRTSADLTYDGFDDLDAYGRSDA